jgi:hypothetical protein
MVTELISKEQFDEAISQNTLSLFFLGNDLRFPGKRAINTFEELSEGYPSINFYKMNTFNHRNVVTPYTYSPFPTYRFYINGNIVDELVAFMGDTSLIEDFVLGHA